MSKTGVRKGKQSQTEVKKTPAKAKASPTRNRRKVTFRVEAEPGSKVFVAGSFNGWDAVKNELVQGEDGAFSTALMLERGSHEYKFVINDVWCVDPTCDDWTPNGMGSLNSVVSIL